MVSQIQKVDTADLYYICQVVDRVTRDPFSYIRHIEDIFGDMASKALTISYPKWTCFHNFLEQIISNLIFEDIEKSQSAPGEYWVDILIKSNGLKYRPVSPASPKSAEPYDYIDALQNDDLIGRVSEMVTKQAFHVLFANRGTMSAFANMLSGYVIDTASQFSPETFGKSGHLKRTAIPSWAKSAIFHRDKGRCVLCRTDLTKYFSQEQKVNYDHILPLAHGGMNCVTNLQLTCASCNLSKGARSAKTSTEYEVWYDY